MWKFLWSKRLWISESLPWRLRRIQGIMYRVVKYSSSLCACYYSLRTELCQYIVHSFCTQFTFHTDRFQLKREISRTMTFCLYYAVTFVERYEKTIKRRQLLSLLLLFDGRCKSNHQRNSICLYTDRESLSARWVLSNHPMKTIYSVFCKQTKSLIALYYNCVTFCCNHC